MFAEYNPIDNKIYQVLDNDGKIILKDWICPFSDEEILRIYKKMLFARTADLMAVSYQRQGRMFTYPPNLGQEAVAIATGLAIRKEDWLVPAFRELAAWIEKGASLKEVFMIFRGNEWGANFKNANRLLPLSVPISSQLLHAVGLGFSLNYRSEKSAAFTFVGEGGTSEGDFYEALNFAGVWKVPVIFVIQNNQFAISVPTSGQTASINFAVKGIAAGISCIKVDGNDVFATYDVLKEARNYAIEGNGPVLIEAVTFRKGAHTTSDDPSRYRTKEEEDFWHKTDPLNRISKFLKNKELWSQEMEDGLLGKYKKKIDNEFEEAEKVEYHFDDIFDYQYVDMPDELTRQREEYKRYLQWNEART